MGNIIAINNHLDGVEDKIDSFIFSICGLHCKERTIGDKYTLSLGIKDPIEIGFYKSRHPEIKDFRMSSYLTMLKHFTQFMMDVNEFEVWAFLQKI